MAITPAGKTGVWHTFDYDDAALDFQINSGLYFEVTKKNGEWEIYGTIGASSDTEFKAVYYNDEKLYDLCCDIGQAMQIPKANKSDRRFGDLVLKSDGDRLDFEGLGHDPGAVVELREMRNPGTPGGLVTVGVLYEGYDLDDILTVSLCPKMHKALVLTAGNATYTIAPGARVNGQIYDPLFDARTTPPDYSKPPFAKPTVVPFFLRSMQLNPS